MAIDKNLLAILVCPLCKGKLVYDQQAEELLCQADRLAFPIQDEIPIMLESEARSMKPDA